MVYDQDVGTEILSKIEAKEKAVLENWEDQLGRECVSWLTQARSELKRIETIRLECVSAAKDIYEACCRLAEDAQSDASQKTLGRARTR